MQTIIKQARSVKMLAFVVLCAGLLSFTHKPGGEGFQIFLNNKLVLQHYGAPDKTVQSLQLDQTNINDQLTIKYHHCGKIGKNRTIMLKDDQNKILKEWHFADASDATNAMTCKVKDILELEKKAGITTINLYYSSSELPTGRLLAAVTSGNNKLTMLR